MKIITIKAISKKGIKALKKNKKDEMKMRKLAAKVPVNSLPPQWKEFLTKVKSTYEDEFHIMEGIDLSNDEAIKHFEDQLEKDMFKINKSKKGEDYEVLIE